jgi:iron complex transport system substrate-binding protein
VTNDALRICSLLPSATEIVCALGLEGRLIGITHECDYPPEAATKPHVTSSVIDSEDLTSREIDQAVRASLEEQATIYHLDRDLLEELRPDLVLTQELCDVCAVGTAEVRSVISGLTVQPKLVSLEPRTLSDVFDSIMLVGRLTGTLRKALALVDTLLGRLERVRRAVADSPRPSVLTLEWVDPVFVGGHWVPEMVQIAGGCDALGRAAEPSREVTWEEVVESAPQVIVAMPCGFGLARSAQELANGTLPPEWSRLPAVVEGRIFAVDGSSYFNRPGPRLVDGVEILATILHPEAFSQAPPNSFIPVLS